MQVRSAPVCSHPKERGVRPVMVQICSNHLLKTVGICVCVSVCVCVCVCVCEDETPSRTCSCSTDDLVIPELVFWLQSLNHDTAGPRNPLCLLPAILIPPTPPPLSHSTPWSWGLRLAKVPPSDVAQPSVEELAWFNTAGTSAGYCAWSCSAAGSRQKPHGRSLWRDADRGQVCEDSWGVQRRKGGGRGAEGEPPKQ